MAKGFNVNSLISFFKKNQKNILIGVAVVVVLFFFGFFDKIMGSLSCGHKLIEGNFVDKYHCDERFKEMIRKPTGKEKVDGRRVERFNLDRVLSNDEEIGSIVPEGQRCNSNFSNIHHTPSVYHFCSKPGAAHARANRIMKNIGLREPSRATEDEFKDSILQNDVLCGRSSMSQTDHENEERNNDYEAEMLELYPILDRNPRDGQIDQGEWEAGHLGEYWARRSGSRGFSEPMSKEEAMQWLRESLPEPADVNP